MKHARTTLGLCLVVGVLPACSGGDDGDTPAVAGTSGSGGGAQTAGAGSGGTAGAGGATNGGQSGSAGGGSGGQAGAMGGAGGSGGAAGSGGSDSLSCSEYDRGCICGPGGPVADAVATCTPESVKGNCCEDPSGTFCSCRKWSCENDAFGCSCGSTVEGPLTKCTGVYGVCCMTVIGTASNCYCDDTLTECVGANDVKVDSCGIETAPCGSGETPVAACKQ